MNDGGKTKEQLIQELEDLRWRIAELEKSESELKRAEEILISEKQLSDSTINSLPGIFYLFDDQGCFQRWNKNFEKVSGYSAEEMSSMHPLNFFTGEDRQRVEQAIQEVFIKGENTVEAEFVSKDGRRTPYLFTGLRITIGQTNCLIGMGIDITERKRDAEEIQKNLRLRQVLMNAIPFPVFYKDAEGIYRGGNKALERLWGRSLNQIIEKTVYDIAPADLAEIYEQADKELLNNQGEQIYETSVVNSEGIRRNVIFNKATFTNDEGRVAGLIGVILDITERKEAEEALRKSEEKYHLIADNSNNWIYLINPDGTFHYVSPSSERLTGYPSEEFIKKPELFLNIIHPDDKRLVKSHLEIGPKESKPHNLEFRIITKEGKIRWIGHSCLPVQNDQGQYIGRSGANRDITERKLAEETLKAMSLTDDLTGLNNRRGFFTLAEQGLKTAQRMGIEMLLIFGDLDNLKEINDTLGHKEGDQALVDISQIIKETFRQSDIIARIGGDEFVILAMNRLETTAEKLLDRFETILQEHRLQRERRYALSMSLGLARFDPQNPCSLDLLLSQADKLMYENKQKKKR